MKNQYFGDVNDYRKYGLLRCLALAGFRIGICWMLTRDVGGNEGKKTKYLEYAGRWRHYDPELFDFLKRCLNAHRRSVRMIEESGLIPGATFYGEILPDLAAERKQYFLSLKEAVGQEELLFFDPDTGLAPVAPAKNQEHSKYLSWCEVEDSWESGKSVVVFQHFRQKSSEFYRQKLIRDCCNELASRLSGATVRAVRGGEVAYLIASQQTHKERMTSALNVVAQTWAGGLTVLDETAANAEEEKAHPRYSIDIFWSDEDDCYVADIPDLKYCSAFGDTPEEALAEVQIAKRLWLDVAQEKGLPVPASSYRPGLLEGASAE